MTQLLQLISDFFRQFIVWVIVEPWEQCIRTRAGKHVKRLKPGFHFRIPVLDQIHKKAARRRNTLINTQTLTTADGKTLVINASLGWSITDIQKLYETMDHPDDTLIQEAATVLADHVLGKNAAEIKPEAMNKAVTDALRETFAGYGLGDVQVRVTDFAYIRAFRIMQDGRWSNSKSMQMEPEK